MLGPSHRLCGALPFKYMTSFGYPTWVCCSRESLGCCSECEHWFCQCHGVMGADVCLACVPEYFLEDRLGGTSVQVTSSVRLQIEKRQSRGTAQAISTLSRGSS